jgi:hypothetical protein
VPVAKKSKVSEVEVSLSTVTQLKLLSAPFFSRACSTGAAIGASVKTKDSMVAMSGAIMPAPLAMPLRVTSMPPMVAVRVATFGKVSVVMIALAASIQAVGFAFFSQAVSTPSNFVASRGSPMTPVEAMNTWEARQPAASAAISAVSLTASAPRLPVKALALPEFTTSARAVPFARFLRHQSTGAEGHLERVNTPATAVSLGRVT